MKRTSLCTALLLALAAAAPFVCLLFPAAPAAAQNGSAPLPSPAAVESAPVPSPAPEITPDPAAALAALPVELYDEAVGEVRTVSVQDYLIGAAACELPPDWPDDAFRAQMVASHSYALYCRGQAGGAGQGWLTVNSALGSGWTDTAALQARWGDAFEENHARLAALAGEVAGALLLYGGQPAMACYHAVSSGHTEASQNVWTEALPYLQGVDSAWDRQSEEFEVTIEYSSTQLAEALRSLGVEAEGDPATWVGGQPLGQGGLCPEYHPLRPKPARHGRAHSACAAQRLLCHRLARRAVCHHHARLRPRRGPEPARRARHGRRRRLLARDSGILFPRLRSAGNGVRPAKARLRNKILVKAVVFQSEKINIPPPFYRRSVARRPPFVLR